MKRLFLLFAVLPLFSCAARINGSIAADGSGLFSVNMQMEPQITALFGRLSAAMGASETGGLILDGSAIAESMSNAPGISHVSFKNTAPAAIEGQVRISNIGEFLAAGGRGFISFRQAPNGGSFALNINRQNGPQVLELLSPEISGFLEMFMAPLVTGENLTRAEYLEEIAAFYSKPISNEIAASRIRVTIDFPGQIAAVKGGTFSGKRADFNIPLLDLLVLETPISCEVTWK